MTSLAKATADQMNLLASSHAVEFPDLAVSQGPTRWQSPMAPIVGFATWLTARDAVEVQDLSIDPAWIDTERGGR